jgi:hypothetical protein
MKTRNLRLLFLFVLLWCYQIAGAQQKMTLNGKVTDAKTGETLIGANVTVYGSTLGTVTNNYGFYSLTLKKNTYKIVVSYIGYSDTLQEIELVENQKLNFSLSPESKKLAEIMEKSEKWDKNATSAQLISAHLNTKQLESIPVFLGEKDVLKTIQLLPGVTATSEANSGFSIRGGSFDQNLVLLDEAPIYNASHLMGLVSVFNSDAIKDISIYKGGIPAEYGGRASSVLNISTKNGNTEKFSTSGGIGLISSRLTFEGPINEQTSFIVSGRRSYADLLAKGLDIVGDDVSLYFYDINAKINHKIDENNQLFLSGYFGKDAYEYENIGADWANSTASLRWNRIWNSKLFSNTSLIYSNYNYGFKLTEEAAMNSGIADFGLKHDFSFYKSPSNTLKFGASTSYHTFKEGELILENNEDNNDLLTEQKQALESAIYFSNYRKLGKWLSIEYGLRLSMLNQFGQGWQNTYDANNLISDSTWFDSGELMQSYFEFEPRLALNFQLGDNKLLKLSFDRMAQYMQQISISTSQQPTDIWVPSTNNIKPLVNNQLSMAYSQNFKNNTYEFSVETYYKDMENVIDYEDGADILLNDDIESQILSGDGRAYGLELLLKKKQGRFTGWLSYTLSRTEQKMDGINSDDWYPTTYDKTHDISVVGSYQFTDRLSLWANWVFYTGNAVTYPSGQYTFDGQTLPYYSERNSYRMPNYHRLDLNLHLLGKQKERYETSWDFSIYNLYDKYNAYTISFDESETTSGSNEATKLSLFGIVPSVTWNFKF